MVAKILGLVFGGVGAAALLVVIFFTIGNLTFISQAATATGTVTRLTQDSEGTNYPLIRFSTPDGRAIQFTGPVGTNPPEFRVGQSVKVYYNPDNPAGSAKPDSFISFWFLPLLFGIFTIVFGGIGVGFYTAYFFAQRKIKWLQQHGQRVVGQVTNIWLNRSMRNGEKSPYVLLVQWLNPQNGQVYTFKSNNIWQDTLPFAPGSPINVLIDQNNLSRYYVDPSTAPISSITDKKSYG